MLWFFLSMMTGLGEIVGLPAAPKYGYSSVTARSAGAPTSSASGINVSGWGGGPGERVYARRSKRSSGSAVLPGVCAAGVSRR